MKLSLAQYVGLALLLAAIALFSVSVASKNTLATGPSASVIGTATTSSAIAVTSSARVLASSSNPLGNPGVTSFTRIYAVICNPNANPVWLNLDLDKASNLPSGAVTTVIAAAAGYNACYEVTDRNLTQGSITASSTNQTSTTITVKDYVQ